MSSLYSNEIRQFVHSRPWPKRLKWRIVEFDDHLKIKFFRDNINKLNSDEKLHLGSILNETLSSIHKQGIPIYTWVAKGDGRDD